jgi:hypothetical protein
VVDFDEPECETEWGEFDDLVCSKWFSFLFMFAEAGHQGCSDRAISFGTSMRVSLHSFPDNSSDGS